MAKRPVPKRPAALYIGEWLNSRGHDQAWLAERINVEPATISRYISRARKPDTGVIQAIEEALDLEPGQLSKPPSSADGAALLAGLSDQAKREVLNFIEYQRRRGE